MYNDDNNNYSHYDGMSWETPTPAAPAAAENSGGPTGSPGSIGPEPPKKQKKPRRSVGVGGIIAICLICSLLAGFLGAGATYLAIRDDDSLLATVADEIVPTTPPQVTTEDSEGAVNETANYIYSLACQQVVGITSEITYYNIFGQSSAASVSGSGVIIDADGYILTNYHVITDAYEGGYTISVLLYDSTEYEAEVVGFDEDNDLAVLKIDATGLSAAELGDSDSLTVGQIIYAVGNPLGELNYTMTSGIVSATDRAITTSESDVAINMFQIDAAVNSGNSGGPVYNTDGQVIGIVTAKTSATGVEGLGFAIPISDAAHIANQILTYGYVTDKASLGVITRTVTATIAKYYNMAEGAYVDTVNEGSAAETAGIQVGDIITAVDDTEVADANALTAAVKSYHAGDTAQITLWRSGETLTLTVTFDEKTPDEDTDTTSQDSSEDDSTQDGNGQYSSGDMEDFFRQFFGFGY